MEDLARVAALLPWWLSTSLAAITYFTLHHFATRTPATPGSGPAGNDMSQMLISLFAEIGQFVVTSGRFTEDAQAFAQGRNIRLIDGPKLQAMLHGLTPRQSPAPSTATSAPTQAGPEAAAAERPASEPPGCPRCGKPMVRTHRTPGGPGREDVLGLPGLSCLPGNTGSGRLNGHGSRCPCPWRGQSGPLRATH